MLQVSILWDVVSKPDPPCENDPEAATLFFYYTVFSFLETYPIVYLWLSIPTLEKKILLTKISQFVVHKKAYCKYNTQINP